MTSKEDLARAVKHIEQAQGFVNVVIANAGYSGPSLQGLRPNASLSELQDHLWNWDSAQLTNVFEVNNIGVLNTTTAFLKLLEAGNKAGNVTQKSQVIATGSAGAYNRVPVGGYAYGGSKAGLIHMMKSFATGLVPYDIRANVIAPGCKCTLKRPVRRQLTSAVYPSEMTENLMKVNDEKGWPKDVVPAQRAGDAQDMTGAVLFLVSRAGAYINGNVLLSDGGRLGVVPSSY